MDLLRALDLALTNGRGMVGLGGAVADMLPDLLGRYGVKAPPGISLRTWQRIRSNPARTIKPATREALEDAQRRARVPADLEKVLRGTPIIGVHAVVRISSDERERKILLNRWTSPDQGTSAGDHTGLMRHVLDDWIAGEFATAADRFELSLTHGLTGDSTVPRGVELVDVYAIRFWPPGSDGGSRAYMWVNS